MAPRFHTLTVCDITRETEDTVSVSFSIPDELRSEYDYLPGQYLTLRKTLNGEEVRRSYSLCTAPSENDWRVAIKKVENGRFSSFANNVLAVGDSLDVMTPAGNFTVMTNASHAKTYVLFAAGSGITPVISILKSILREEPNSQVTLFYGNKNAQSVIFKEEIEGLKNEFMARLRVIHVMSRENLGTPILKGRIDREKADELYAAFLKGVEIDGVYICGPEAMILGVKDSMIDNGIDAANVHFELFTTASTPKQEERKTSDEPTVQSNVTIIMDGDAYDLHLDSDGLPLLDAAQETGADLPFACKGGVCCTCKAKVLEGSARMDVNYALEPDEVEAGYILTCQSHPTSDRLVVSFDE